MPAYYIVREYSEVISNVAIFVAQENEVFVAIEIKDSHDLFVLQTFGLISIASIADQPWTMQKKVAPSHTWRGASFFLPWSALLKNAIGLLFCINTKDRALEARFLACLAVFLLAHFAIRLDAERLVAPSVNQLCIS